jgi:hypothetical protein
VKRGLREQGAVAVDHILVGKGGCTFLENVYIRGIVRIFTVRFICKQLYCFLDDCIVHGRVMSPTHQNLFNAAVSCHVDVICMHLLTW